jgi:hypothetical protein
MRRKTKEVLTELVGKLKEKLDPKRVAATSAGEQHQRGELRANLDRLTVGVDLGDQWSNYCILGLEGERWRNSVALQKAIEQIFSGVDAREKLKKAKKQAAQDIKGTDLFGALSSPEQVVSPVTRCKFASPRQWSRSSPRSNPNSGMFCIAPRRNSPMSVMGLPERPLGEA